MVENVQSAMFEILKRIQSDVSDVKTRLESVETRLGLVETKLETVARDVKKTRLESAGMMVLMRSAAGTFDKRLTDIEDDVKFVKEHLGLGLVD